MDEQLTQKTNRAAAASMASEAIRKAEAGARASELINRAAANPQSVPGPGKVRGPARLDTDQTFIDTGSSPADTRYTTVDKNFSDKAYQENILQRVGIGRNANKRKNRPANVAEGEDRDQLRENENSNQVRPQSKLSKTLQNRLALKSALKPVELLTRARVTSINMGVLSWQFPLWLFVQLPFAILSIVCLGATMAVDSMATANGGLLGFLANKSLAVFDTIAKTIGIDFAGIAFDMFLLGMVLVLAIGLMSLLVMTLIYLMSGIHPLNGKGSSMKQGMFLLAILCYAIPFANMFPVVFLYMAAVWLHPK